MQASGLGLMPTCGMESKRERLARIIETLDELVLAIGTQLQKKAPDLNYVFDHYGDAHEEMGLEMHALAVEFLEENAPEDRPADLREPDSLLDHTRNQVAARMKELFPGEADALLKIPRYGWAQRVILELLAQNVGRPVPATRIRTLLNEQVHAERRMRELRELGFEIAPHQQKGKTHYQLAGLDPDLDKAAQYFLKRNKKKKGLA